MISAFTDTVSLERETALETGNVDTTRHLEINCWFHFFASPNPFLQVRK
jgi:hypothetical protein